MDVLVLTPLELIDRMVALVPLPRTHRHRNFGVLAPNSPLRSRVVEIDTRRNAHAALRDLQVQPLVRPLAAVLEQGVAAGYP